MFRMWRLNAPDSSYAQPPWLGLSVGLPALAAFVLSLGLTGSPFDA